MLSLQSYFIFSFPLQAPSKFYLGENPVEAGPQEEVEN